MRSCLFLKELLYGPITESRPRPALYGESFSVDLLETVPHLASKTQELEEVRIVQTAITSSGMRRLRTLFPNTTIYKVSEQEYRADPHATDAAYNIRTKQFDLPREYLRPRTNAAEELRKRYGNNATE
jgi:hypothetical protein